MKEPKDVAPERMKEVSKKIVSKSPVEQATNMIKFLSVSDGRKA